MAKYVEYDHKIKDGYVKAYQGETVCPKCGSIFKLNTTDFNLFDKSQCLKCFMENK